MRNIKLTLEYDGTDLCGWQRQKNGPTVQETLEQALADMVRAPVTVIGASRTDAGVHARGQIANFHTRATIPVLGFRRGLNGLLPPAIAVVDAEEVAPAFHARFDAVGKHYRYLLLVRPERSPLLRHRAWHRRGRLDVAAMAEAARALVGTHDFSAFRAAGCQAASPVRRISAIEVAAAPEQPLVRIDVEGDGFLRNMVRIVAGTLVDIGEGRRTTAAAAEALASCDRTRAGQTAPAHGLTLMRVDYAAARQRPDARIVPIV